METRPVSEDEPDTSSLTHRVFKNVRQFVRARQENQNLSATSHQLASFPRRE